jgi:hypothetical protein
MAEGYMIKRPIEELVRSRISVRNYKNADIEQEVFIKLNRFIGEVLKKYNSNIRIELINMESIKRDKDVKLGTYGVIRGTSHFIAAAVKKKDMNLVDLGLIIEHIVLYATELGLGTCYLAGTFKRSEFSKALELAEDEVLPMIISIGYPKDGLDFIGSFFKLAAGSKKRKPWSELFFNETFERALTEAEAGDFANALEMVRLAPSASNRQPWRIVKEGRKFYFYISRNAVYSKALGFDTQMIDMGIAMSHFQLALEEKGMKGQWCKDNEDLDVSINNITYLISWIND